MTRFAVVCLALLTMIAGCAKQPGLTQGAAPAPTGAAGTSSAPGPATLKAAAAAQTTARSSTPRGASTTYTGTARPKPADFVEHADLQDIHFDFDRYDLRDDDRQILDKHAAWMKDHVGTLMLVEGHCDERGTAEYNISLGERRAKTTANYLASRGVASDRMTIVSYGVEVWVPELDYGGARARAGAAPPAARGGTGSARG
jgi:peptidoglycan-associated lipoprotein